LLLIWKESRAGGNVCYAGQRVIV